MTVPGVRRLVPVGAALLLAAGLGVAGAPGAAAGVSEAEAERVVLDEFDVEVLQTRPATVDGRDVWLVKVMHKGGNSNVAFKVDTIAVDRETGELLLGAYREAPDDDNLSSARTGATEKRPEAARSFIWR